MPVMRQLDLDCSECGTTLGVAIVDELAGVLDVVCSRCFRKIEDQMDSMYDPDEYARLETSYERQQQEIERLRKKIADLRGELQARSDALRDAIQACIAAEHETQRLRALDVQPVQRRTRHIPIEEDTHVTNA